MQSDGDGVLMPEFIGKYLTDELAPRQPESGKTKRWLIRNSTSRAVLGSVGWYGPWRAYIFEPHSQAECAFSSGCLRDIADFLDLVSKAHKERKAS